MGALKSRDLTRRHQIKQHDWTNLYSFLSHLQQLTANQLNDVARLRNGLNIRRPKKKSNMLNDKRIKSCLSRFNSGAYSRLQFLRAVSHSVGAHTACLQLRDDESCRSSENEDEDQQEPVPVATTSTTSDSTTAAEATSSDDFCEVCFAKPPSMRNVAAVPIFNTI